ncbi:CoA-transferase subunit beta [Bacillus shivajii]|uniref:CoA-transferase subunit beta n=1 Tax=Bacillus shivajii TaxID=1983719 RepID=UPI001CF9EC0A|nr:CoA-transferase subunit beta [Bacillus shivajii]UCZ52750.1 CoA-transferase subunit beta [Bacillus shivajii]
MNEYTPDEMMAIAAARQLNDRITCFVGIGLPSTAANLARQMHAPNATLIYESGTIGAKPETLPLSIGDDELAETADTIVPLPEIFNYWLQGGRVDIGFLGGAQIDKFGNLNTTVIGEYDEPKVRLPGAGGAPEIAALAKEVFIVMSFKKRAFVESLEFITSVGYYKGNDTREKLGFTGKGPTKVITDLGILSPDPKTKELVLTEVYPGVSIEDVKANCGWELNVSDRVITTAPPEHKELEQLRRLKEKTRSMKNV